jgi:drug/metabolite transporter (DMT)-like permease
VPLRIRLAAGLTTLALLWGLAFVAIKEILRDLSPVTLTVARFAVADACLLVLMAAWPAARPRFERRDFWRLLVLGVTGVPMYHLALNWGEQRTSASVAALVVATAPVMVAVLAAVVLRERVGARKVFGIALAFGGVALLAFGRHESAENSTQIAGVLVAMLAPVAWAIYTIVAKPLTARAGAVRVAVVSMLIGSLMVFPLANARTFHELGAMRASNWVWLVFIGVGSSVGGYVLFVWALSRLDATKASVLLYAVPVVAVLSAWLLRGEHLGWIVAASGALVVAGVGLVQMQPSEDRRVARESGARAPELPR